MSHESHSLFLKLDMTSPKTEELQIYWPESQPEETPEWEARLDI